MGSLGSGSPYLSQSRGVAGEQDKTGLWTPLSVSLFIKYWCSFDVRAERMRCISGITSFETSGLRT